MRQLRRRSRVSTSFSTIPNGLDSGKKLSVEDAIKAAANSSLTAMGASVRRSSTTKDGDVSYGRRGSEGSTSNNSVKTNSRSVSPADESIFNNCKINVKNEILKRFYLR